MTVRYCGPGGSDSNDGLSWVNRKLTLNGLEDSPVAAGDICYIAPGVYRETLTVDVSGSSGNPIVYIGDISGANTDGVGGVVRITGSDNDQTTVRTNCITMNAKTHRTFRGFWMGHSSSFVVSASNVCTDIIFEDCTFSDENNSIINFSGAVNSITIRRCLFMPSRFANVVFTHGSTVDNSNCLVENCIFIGCNNQAVSMIRVGGVTVRNCLFWGGNTAVRVNTALSVGQTTTVNNNIFVGYSTVLQGTTTGEVTEDYNDFFNNNNSRVNTSTGANSITYPPLFQALPLVAGYRYPWSLGELSQWSQLRALAGNNEATDTIFGISRPAVSAKKSWGATQYPLLARETTTKRTGTASLKLADAGRHQMFVPTSNVSTTISVYVQWEADYAGTKPRMIVKQPGQADQSDTATGSAGTWEELSVTLTPAAIPGYVVVELVSSNEATSGNFATYFDDLTVT